MCPLSPIFSSKRTESFVLPKPDGRREERSEMAGRLSHPFAKIATHRRHDPPPTPDPEGLFRHSGRA